MRPGRSDIALGLGGALLAGVVAAQAPFAAVLMAVALGGGLSVARRRPTVAWPVAAVLVIALAGVDKVDDRVFGIVGITFTGYAFCAARWSGLRTGLAGTAALIAGGLVATAITHGAAVPVVLVCATGWGAGRALREREQVATALAERARELDAEREAYAALSVRYERTRIASELHDIVAHAISVMVIQASAGQRLAARDPAASEEAFGAIAEAARQAEQDMGRLVALLGDEGAIGPPPDLHLVQELVARAAGSGLDVTLRLEGDRDGLPAPVGETAYRVVREGLTNAMRYAAGAPVTVTVRGGSTLMVEVSNPPAPDEAALTGAGTGTGLAGLRDRIGSLGGALEAGPTLAGGWRLRAELPTRGDALALDQPRSGRAR